MQVDGIKYGIIPDTFATILQNYLTPLQKTFPNATDPSSPAYTIMYLTSGMDQILQSALTSLWNAVNANTAQGLGLDILASTILNLSRPGIQPSSLQVQVQVQPIYSVCQIQVTVAGLGMGDSVTLTASLPPAAPGAATTVTGGITTTSPYYLQNTPTAAITVDGIYYYNFYSTDTSTQIPVNNFTGYTNIAIVGPAVVTITNTTPGTLGSLVLPVTWYVNSSTNTAIPKYYPNAPITFKTGGTYNFLVYCSTDLITVVSPSQVNNASSYFPAQNAPSYNLIKSVINNYENVLGRPALNDAEFSALRRYYLNVEGQTYYGLEKAIIDLQITGLEAVNIAETIADLPISMLIVQVNVDVTVGPGPVIFPEGWSVNVPIGPFPNPSYATLQSYTFSSTGIYYIPLYSTDVVTVVPAAGITTSFPPVTGLLSFTNLEPSIVGSNKVGLGERGYTIYLEYNTLNLNESDIELNITPISPNVPYIIPAGWVAVGPTTTSPYVTRQSYSITNNFPAPFTIKVYSQDTTTVVGVNSFTGGTAISGVTFTVASSTAAVITQGFDQFDPNLQLIANTAFAFHPLGTQFYPAPIGATDYTVNLPYSGYTSTVILNPFQIIQVYVNLEFVYNANPADAGYSNGVFNPLDYPNLKSDIIGIINNYFLSKTLPTDMFYYINELAIILQNTYPGIVSLVGTGVGTSQFSFSLDNVTWKPFLERTIGSNFNLINAKFTFLSVDKDTL